MKNRGKAGCLGHMGGMCHSSLAWGEVGRYYFHLGEHSGIVGLHVVAAPDLVAELRARKGL